MQPSAHVFAGMLIVWLSDQDWDVVAEPASVCATSSSAVTVTLIFSWQTSGRPAVVETESELETLAVVVEDQDWVVDLVISWAKVSLWAASSWLSHLVLNAFALEYVTCRLSRSYANSERIA